MMQKGVPKHIPSKFSFIKEDLTYFVEVQEDFRDQFALLRLYQVENMIVAAYA